MLQGLIRTIPVNTYVGPGDTNPGATAWWGMRAYSIYTIGKPALDVIRASDSTVKTIYTVPGGGLDVAGLTSFLTSTTGKITKLYDQTGNGFDVTQTTDANRPTIILSGIGGLPSAGFLIAASTNMTSTNSMTVAQPFSISTVVEYDVVTSVGGSLQFVIVADAGDNLGMSFGNTGFFPDQVILQSAGSPLAASAVHAVNHAITGIFFNAAGSAGTSITVDGVTTSGSIGDGTAFTGHVVLGSGPTAAANTFLGGQLAEVGIWPYVVTP